MNTYYLKYQSIHYKNDSSKGYNIWETTEDCAQERCIYDSELPQSRLNNEWREFYLTPDNIREYDIIILTKAEIFLEML